MNLDSANFFLDLGKSLILSWLGVIGLAAGWLSGGSHRATFRARVRLVILEKVILVASSERSENIRECHVITIMRDYLKILKM